MVATSLERGKVDLNIWIDKDDAVCATPINAALVENYYTQIKDISMKTGIPEPQDWFSTLLRMPDVMNKTEVEVLDDEEWSVVKKALEDAIGKLVDFRKQEGAALQKKFMETAGLGS